MPQWVDMLTGSLLLPQTIAKKNKNEQKLWSDRQGKRSCPEMHEIYSIGRLTIINQTNKGTLFVPFMNFTQYLDLNIAPITFYKGYINGYQIYLMLVGFRAYKLCHIAIDRDLPNSYILFQFYTPYQKLYSITFTKLYDCTFLCCHEMMKF